MRQYCGDFEVLGSDFGLIVGFVVCFIVYFVFTFFDIPFSDMLVGSELHCKVAATRIEAKAKEIMMHGSGLKTMIQF